MTIGPVTATYDALGRMVEQAWINGQNQLAYDQMVYDPLGRKLFFGNNQSLWWARVPLPDGGRAAYTVSNGTAYVAFYTHADWLGSERFFSTQNRTMYGDVAYAPFGETYAQSGTIQSSFTGQNADTVSVDYDFLKREYSFVGRWVSPDPAGVSSTCPKDPQTQNRYAYVRNNPMSFTDPTEASLQFLQSGEYDGGDPCDVFFWDPFCGCDPFGDPNCGVGGGGASAPSGLPVMSGTGGGTEMPRPFPWPSLPPGFFGALEGGDPAPPSPAVFVWECAPFRDKPTFGACQYGCLEQFRPGFGITWWSIARLSRDCKFPVTTVCPSSVTVESDTELVAGIGARIVRCVRGMKPN